jgi:hypothetical protein
LSTALFRENLMTAFFKKHSPLILMSLLLTLLVLSWMIPSERLFFGITFVLLSFLVGSAAILAKHQQAYRDGRITRAVFFRNAVLEIGSTLTIMLLAGLLGRYVAQIATQPIEDDLLRVIAGLGVAMFVGIGVGVLAKKTLRPLIEAPRVE